MSKKSNETFKPSEYPRAPPFDEIDDNVLQQRPSPPSYEESLRQQPFQQVQLQGNSSSTYGCPQAYAYPSVSNQPYMVYPNGYQTYAGPSQQPPVLQLAKGAEVRKTATGAISIPPPPPGCAPTPAQWAAMQGQTVLVKEPKKRSFFS